MAVDQARRKLARALNDNARRVSDRRGRNHQLAKVVSTNPIKVDLLDSKMVLVEGNDLSLGGWLRQYQAVFGVDRGDTLVLHRVSGHWVAHDVLEDGGERLDKWEPGSDD